MAKKKQLSKEEKERRNQLTEVFFAELDKLESHPEGEDFTITPDKREAFLTAGRRLQNIVETARKSGAIGGKSKSEVKLAHLKNIAKKERPGRSKTNAAGKKG